MTYIYQQLTTSDITHALMRDDYASWHKNYDACKALAEYLEQYAEETGEAIELDTVAIRCDFSMYSDIAELNKEYDTDFTDMDELRDHAQVIDVDGEAFITDYTG
jgi:hypothetical protein